APPLYALFFNHLCFLTPSDANWPPRVREILMAVLKWEVWGLYTQLSQIPQEDLVKHLARLRERSSSLLDKTQNDLAVNYLLFLSKKFDVE
ncbi:MAG: hypothetical protein KUL82_07795, partial [Bdellovibrio sp.]|nr:hypothetical protein [Bdellovibrio sp.]